MILDINELNRRLSDGGNLATRFRKDSPLPISSNDNSQESNPAPNKPITPIIPQGKNKKEELAHRRETLPVTQRGGRFNGTTNIPPVMRELIGTCARLGSVKGTAETFGVTTTHTQNLKQGKTYANGPTLPDLDLKIKENVNIVRQSVVETLKDAVGRIPLKLASEEKLTAKDLSVIAKNLSSILNATKEKEEKEDEGNVHFHVHVPQTKTIDSYPVIEVS